jgi:fructose-bisphosphate aldolase class II
MSQYELTPLAAVLSAAEKVSQQGDPAAVGAFNVNFFTQAQGVLEGLRRANAPTIIQASKGANRFQGGPDKIFYMVTKAMEDSDHQLPVALHLDHGNVEKGEQCADSGYTGIMIDASDEEFPLNVAITRGMVAYGHPRGVGVEGEYGQLSGIEEDIVHQETVYANPENVVQFFRESSVDALAVAYGTSHGPNKGANISEVRTDIVRDSYEDMVEAGLNDSHFLVGHGSSTVPQDLVKEINELGGNLVGAQGVPLEKLEEGISYGLRKINIDTDLRLGITATTRKFFKDNPSAAETEALSGAKRVLDEQLDVIDPRDYLGEVKPFDILREPPKESGVQAFVDLMALIKERIAAHVEFLVNEFGIAGHADAVEDVSQEQMKERYAESDPW